MTESKVTLNLKSTVTVGATVQTLPKFPPLHRTIHDTTEQQQEFFRALSQQVGEWSRYNFGVQSAHRPAMGMVEELNELKMGLLQLNSHDVLDAVGDATIYMADYFSVRGWDMGEAWRDRSVTPLTDPIEMGSQLSRSLCHHHLKGEQGIRGGSESQDISMRLACGQALWFLLSMSNFLGVDYIELVAKVWGEVKHRDWKKNKDNAHHVAATFDPSKKLPQEPPPGVPGPLSNYEVGDEVHE